MMKFLLIALCLVSIIILSGCGPIPLGKACDHFGDVIRLEGYIMAEEEECILGRETRNEEYCRVKICGLPDGEGGCYKGRVYFDKSFSEPAQIAAMCNDDANCSLAGDSKFRFKALVVPPAPGGSQDCKFVTVVLDSIDAVYIPED